MARTKNSLQKTLMLDAARTLVEEMKGEIAAFDHNIGVVDEDADGFGGHLYAESCASALRRLCSQAEAIRTVMDTQWYGFTREEIKSGK